MKTTKPFSLEEFKAIYSKVPRLCVELVIKTPKGIVLTLRTLPDWKNQWHLPGSTVLYKELIEDTAHRIAREELGVEVTIQKLLGYRHANEEQERGYGRSISIVLLCRLKKGMPTPNEDASEAKIFSSLPRNTIKEQRTFLKKTGLI